MKRRLNQAFSVLVILAGGAPTKRISLRNSTSKASWESGAPAKRISSRNSTNKASWESGPQQREFH
ncbi:nitrogen fixation protein NifR [Staphylococcus borealis]|nr:nitrogen fixation protein NifR [Staphylococcus borealis]RIO71893.1 nitrogen fixation protein NifR [Staphylococcus borealis]